MISAGCLALLNFDMGRQMEDCAICKIDLPTCERDGSFGWCKILEKSTIKQGDYTMPRAVAVIV